jgi:dTDP-glucose 4,6-dehydratase
MRNENIVMTSDGSAHRAFCYVSDAVAGFFTVLLTGNPATAYNVTNASAILSVMELAELLVSLYPEKRIHVARSPLPTGSPYIPSTISHVVPDASRLEALGWRANIDPAVGFRRMIDAYG